MISFKYIHDYKQAGYCAMSHTREPIIGTVSPRTVNAVGPVTVGVTLVWCYSRDVKNYSIIKFSLKQSQYLHCPGCPQALFCGEVLTRIMDSDQYI